MLTEYPGSGTIERDNLTYSGNESHRKGATTLKERSPYRHSLLLRTTQAIVLVPQKGRDNTKGAVAISS